VGQPHDSASRLELASLSTSVIAHLRGRLLDKQPNRLIVDVQGVGYEVYVPLSTFYDVGDPGADVALRIHTHVREETLSLFGFATARELQIFERLIAISGVGPKLALAVLSGIEPAELVRAVRGNDIARLTRIPGVGKKTSERIVLELKDRLPPVVDQEEPAAVPAPEDQMRTDVLSALVNLGYHRPLAEKAVDRAFQTGGGSFENTLKQALRELAR
jgi:Holliday junction DNA helicase RuvA